MYVINSVEPEHVPATATADARLVWIGDATAASSSRSSRWTCPTPS